MATPEHFWDRNAPKYAKSKIGDMPAYEATLDRIRHYLEPHHRMLEFACGTGSTALILRDHVKHIIGTDISGEMQRIATTKAADAGATNVEFRKAGALTSSQMAHLTSSLVHQSCTCCPDGPTTFASCASTSNPAGFSSPRPPA